MEEVSQKVLEEFNSAKYDFLRDYHKNKIIVLGLGGSYAYGINCDGSDLDIRGIALNTKDEILLGRDFETFMDSKTDTVIHSFNKMMRLLARSNPNIIEMLGLEDWQYLYLHPIAKELIEKKSMFLSGMCKDTFGGYATAYLKKLENNHAMTRDKLGKIMCHVIRLYMMATDMLEKQEIITYRKDDINFLMSIRQGSYLTEANQPKPEFYEVVSEYKKKFEYAAENTSLPNSPDNKQIDEFMKYVKRKLSEVKFKDTEVLLAWIVLSGKIWTKNKYIRRH